MSALHVADINCPGCGASVATQQGRCNYCGREIVVTSFSSVFGMGPPETRKYIDCYQSALQASPADPALNTAVGMCYLNLGLHQKAFGAFERAIEDDFENPETYFYAAIALLGGGRPYSLPMAEVRAVEKYLDAACRIEPRGIFYYFHAFLKFDFFERKCLNTAPSHLELLARAREKEVAEGDLHVLEELLGYSIGL